MRIWAAVLSAVVILLAGIWIGANPGSLPGPVDTLLVQPLTGGSESTYREATDLIEDRYYRKPRPEELVDSSIRGMVAGLRKEYRDKFSHYFDPKELSRFEESINGSFSGVGMTVGDLKEEGFEVGYVFDRSPAAKAGFEPGDVIVSVDGKPIGGDGIDSVVARIKGPEGTEVTLGVRRRGDGPVKRVTLTREEITVPVTSTRIIDRAGAKLGYVRFSSFSTDSALALRRALRKVLDRGAEGIVLDLRENGGGLLPEAVFTSSLFIPRDSLVVETRSRVEGNRKYRAVGGRLDLPRVVTLVNRGTASAAEILAAALRKYLDSTLVGTRTYGKGLFQQVIQLDNGGALDLSIGEFLTADGVSLAGRGLPPDVFVPQPRGATSDRQLSRALSVLSGELARESR